MGDIGKGIAELIFFLLIVCAISVPLGLWKLVDIVILLSHHVSLSLH